MNQLRRPLRMIAPGIYTTFDGRYRIENIRVATSDTEQQDTWEIYLQQRPGVTADTLDQHATFISGEHQTLTDATDALAEICSRNLVSGCIKECPCIPTPVEQLQPGQLVDLEGDPFADQHRDHTRYEWELVEVVEVHRETPDCICVTFDETVVGFPPTHLLRVLDRDDESRR